MNRLLQVALIVGAAVVVVAIAAVLFVRSYLHEELPALGDDRVFTIEPGTAFGTISQNLGEEGIIDHPDLFRWYARFAGKAGAVQAGEYVLTSGLTPVTLLDKFTRGDVRLYSFTIVEGWSFRELLAAMAASEHIAVTLTDEDWPALLEDLETDFEHPEGLFLPETYHFPKGASDVDVLRQAHDLLLSTLESAWESRAAGLPIDSPYEALILASIVEKETALASERPRIAGVFVRRLQEGMRLQTDPTVIYGIGPDFDGNITRAHLRTDTPYNTYTRGGLPPTPIAMPGAAAINAAVNPADGTELFFVATGLGDGSHKFSDTKDQHDAAVQEYLRRLRAQRDNPPGEE